MPKEPLEIVEDICFEKQFALEREYIDLIPPTLYHYTNTAAFIKILQNKSLWASRAEFLNDAKEFHFGLEICRREIERLAELDAKYASFVEAFRSAMNFTADSPFITCFCADGDLLSQWRGYSSHGQGISIGFNSKQLGGIKRSRLHSVIYDSVRQSTFMFEQIKCLADAYLTVGVEVNEPSVFNDLVGWTGGIERYCVMMKDTAFREECEARLSIPDFQVRPGNVFPISFRAKNNLIVPYIEIDLSSFWPEVVVDIVIGPGPDPELRQANISHFLKLIGLGQVVVTQSKCQYRQ